MLRKLRGVTQEALADEVAVSRSYLSKVEQGQVSVTLDVLERLATALVVDPFDLVAERSEICKHPAPWNSRFQQ
ncbi:helix-turn-helix domain-containing protein [Roseovarius sp. M141]|uniref:helix-turn-helix domain-containing protein n=1 Tax=Roseovarius sp. M141 TaxID=2583806 RepID=UPI0034E97A2B